jgi:glutamine---fructose-6-phosphate transaminase (isomerizing)
MKPSELFTYREITTQPVAWAEAYQVVAQSAKQITTIFDHGYDQVIFTGCGSTYYLSLTAAALFQQLTGKIARGVPASELLLNSSTILGNQKTLLIAVSRSGSTTETIRAVEKFKRERQGSVISITNYGEEPLAGLGEIALVIPAGQETSVAQTRSFASMYVATTAIAALLGGQNDLLAAIEKLPLVGERLLKDYSGLAHSIGADLSIDRFYFLGSGLRYGLACETNLKLKEMTLTHSEPFHFMEFRHGPMSMVTPNTLIIGMLSDGQRDFEEKVIDDMKALGGRTLTLAEGKADVEFNSQVPEAVRGVLYLPVLQLMAFERSIAKGLNPDNPTNLSKVIQLDIN